MIIFCRTTRVHFCELCEAKNIKYICVVCRTFIWLKCSTGMSYYILKKRSCQSLCFRVALVGTEMLRRNNIFSPRRPASKSEGTMSISQGLVPIHYDVGGVSEATRNCGFAINSVDVLVETSLDLNMMTSKQYLAMSNKCGRV